MNRPPTSPPEREDRLNEILLAYVEALQAGQAPDQGQLLADHPEFRAELAAFFEGHNEVERLVAPLRECGLKDERDSQSRSVPENPPAELGQLGDFRLLREVGRGGMGVVYEAEQISLHRRVALKVLPFAAAIDPRQLQRFKNEALAAAQLRHEHIVPVYAVGTERAVHYYAMQFIDGQSLAALIEELRHIKEIRNPKPEIRGRSETQRSRPDVGSTVEEKRSATTTPSGFRISDFGFRVSEFYRWAAGLGRQAAQALEHAHQAGIVHRDVKPANLLLDCRGQLWVTDFGLAQVAGDVGLTATGELLGTLRYASPEQALARRGVVDHRSDVYSLGATLYELLTLRPIFEGRDRNEILRQIADEEPRPPRAVNPAMPVELETIVLKALGKEPQDRYASAQELADDLGRFLEDRPILARRPSPAERLRKWTRRHPGGIIAALVMLVLLSAGSLVSTALVHSEQKRTRAEQQKAEEAYQRERQRADEADARFHLARRAVDELIRISEEELADRPGMEWLRKRLLTSVLAYYQEFIEQRADDPRALTDLLGTTGRVEKILADLAVLRAASKLHLLGQPAVLDDLHLSEAQRAKVKELASRLEKQWMASFGEMAKLTPTERGRQFLKRARANEAEVNGILTREQVIRLRQIGLQSDVSDAFRDSEVRAVLNLTPEQRERIRAIEDAAFFEHMKPLGRPTPAETTEPKPRPLNERILAVLTEAQAQRWQEMTGEPFKGQLLPFSQPHFKKVP
jgi:serine/threonine protein kinase